MTDTNYAPHGLNPIRLHPTTLSNVKPKLRGDDLKHSPGEWSAAPRATPRGLVRYFAFDVFGGNLRMAFDIEYSEHGFVSFNWCLRSGVLELDLVGPLAEIPKRGLLSSVQLAHQQINNIIDEVVDYLDELYADVVAGRADLHGTLETFIGEQQSRNFFTHFKATPESFQLFREAQRRVLGPKIAAKF